MAVTFAVPEGLVDEFAFEPGQHLTLRATIRGEDVRQSYSICQSRRADPAGRRLRVAAARVPEGRMSNWLNDGVSPGDVVEVMTPAGSLHLSDAPRAAYAITSRSRRGPASRR